MERARPTIRCLREDLSLKLPPASESLDQVDHPLLRKAAAQFASSGASHERIVSIDDNVLLKAKIGRWRGAVWQDTSRPWLVAAGEREQGSNHDFYEDLERRAKRERSVRNSAQGGSSTKACYTDDLLPTDLDKKRLLLETAAHIESEIRSGVRSLVCASILCGHPKSEEIVGGCTVEILVRAHGGETYVGVHVHGSVRENVQAVILDSVPGCDRDSWLPDFMPDRANKPGEVIWSNLMDPQVAAELLDSEESDGRVATD